MGDIPYDVEFASIVFVCCLAGCVALCFDCVVPILEIDASYLFERGLWLEAMTSLPAITTMISHGVEIDGSLECAQGGGVEN
jgi:NADH:ubiquinone oxidoreductase subunit 6 (subunit J)